jgi:bacillopeptidase F
MHNKFYSLFILLFSLTFFLLVNKSAVAAATINTDLHQILSYQQQTDLVEIIVDFSDEVDLTKLKLKGFNYQAKYILASINTSKSSQQKLIAYLASKNITEFKKLWMINSLAVTVEAQMISDITALVGVSRIRHDRKIKLDAISNSTPGTPEWNITQVNAPLVWASGAGFTGQNVVIGSLDTGVDVNHPDLASRFRGNGNSWFDPYKNSTAPYDLNGHGTSVMSIIVGGNNSGTNIGIAPGSQWISAKIFDDNGVAQISKIHEAFQWMLNPDGNSSTNDFPTIINNSWNFESQGKACDDEFRKDFDALTNAGITIVFSAGNNTRNLSPANTADTISVGALDESLNVESYSGRGPSACAATGIYPNLVAPGKGIFTADLTSGGTVPNSYVFQTGTSFSAPHITGALALLQSAFPTSSRADRERAISYSAVDLGITGEDTNFGWGYLNVYGAYLTLEAIVGGQKLVTLPPVANNIRNPLYKDTTEIIINLLDNDAPDTRIDNTNQLDPVSVTIISGTNTAIGGISTPVNGVVTYTPVNKIFENNSFTYTVKDTLGNESNIATVRIEVSTPVPVTNSGSSGGCSLQLKSRVDPLFPLMLVLFIWLFVRRMLVVSKKMERY